MNGYGAVENRPKTGVVTGAVVGVALLVVAVAGVIAYQNSQHRARDAADYESLNAEHDALKAAAAPLAKLAELAKPDTPPADYAKALADARSAYEAYSSPPRRSKSLPSGRPWPGQFAAADTQLKSAVDHFGMVPYYLDMREKAAKANKVTGTTNVDSDIGNITGMATDAYAVLAAALATMQRERDTHAWEYGPAPATPSK